MVDRERRIGRPGCFGRFRGKKEIPRAEHDEAAEHGRVKVEEVVQRFWVVNAGNEQVNPEVDQVKTGPGDAMPEKNLNFLKFSVSSFRNTLL